MITASLGSEVKELSKHLSGAMGIEINQSLAFCALFMVVYLYESRHIFQRLSVHMSIYYEN